MHCNVSWAVFFQFQESQFGGYGAMKDPQDYFITRLPLILSWVLDSSMFATGNEGLLAFRVGLGVSSSSRFFASSTLRGEEISFLWLMKLVASYMLNGFGSVLVAGQASDDRML